MRLVVTGAAGQLGVDVVRFAESVGDDVVGDLLVEVANAPIPIGIWVGPSGARFYGTAAQLLAVADVTGIAHVGEPEPSR